MELLEVVQDEMKGICEILQEFCDNVRCTGRLLVKLMYLHIRDTDRSIPIDIYNRLNDQVEQYKNKGLVPVMMLGDDTDSYLTCFLFNLLRKHDGLDPIILGGLLLYEGKDKGIYLDRSLDPNKVGYVFMDTDITLPVRSISFTNHVNMMSDHRIVNVNDYLGTNNRTDYIGKYPMGTTQILLSVCKTKGIDLKYFNYFLRSDMGKIPTKKLFKMNMFYYVKMLGFEDEFCDHVKEYRLRKKKSRTDYMIFEKIYIEDGLIQFKNNKDKIMWDLKDMYNPHDDVRLRDLIKIYDIEGCRYNVKEVGELCGNVDDGVFTVYNKRNTFIYDRVKPVKPKRCS